MNTSPPSRWRSLGVPAALLVLALIYGWDAVSVTAQFDEGLVGPKFMPLLLTVVVIFGLLCIMHKEWRSNSVVTDPAESVPDMVPETGSSGHGKPALVIATIIVYIAIFKLLGYPLATLILAFVLLTLFGYGKTQPVRRLGVAACITGVFYLLFMVSFSVRLPLFPGAGI